MPQYIVEDLQTEEQVLYFNANNIKDALYSTLDELCNRGVEKLLADLERVDEFHGYIRITLPFGAHYDYEVGEEGH